MTEGTKLDWQKIAEAQLGFYAGLTDRVMTHLRLLDGDYGGFKVDRLTHSLQTATRAYRADRDDEYIACALIHDIGDTLATFNHPDIGAAIVKPFVSEGYHWMVEKHGIFQGYYFFHHLGLDRNLRDQFIGHPYYDLCAEFCADYDQPAVRSRLPDDGARGVRSAAARALRPSEAVDLPLRFERSHIMKAAVFYEIGGPEVFKYEDVDDPRGAARRDAGRGRRGRHPGRRPAAPPGRRAHDDAPRCRLSGLGCGARGGRRRRRLRRGRSVVATMGFGSHAELVSVPTRAAWRVPEGSRSRRPPASRSSSARRTTASSSSVT